MGRDDLISTQDNHKIDLLLDAICRAEEGMDARESWPAAAGQIEAYFSDIFALQLFQKYRTNKFLFRTAVSFLTLGKIRSLFYHSPIIGLKAVKVERSCPLTTEDIVGYTVFLIDILKERAKSDPFCRDGKFSAWGAGGVEAQIKNLKWAEVLKEKIRRKVIYLYLAAESLVWRLQFDIYRTAGSFTHGPYHIPGGVLVVKEFFDLDPYYWQLKNRYHSMRAFLVYEPKTEINYDFSNHPRHRGTSKRLLKFSISVNNYLLKPTGFAELTDYYERLGSKVSRQVNQMGPTEIVKLGAKINWFMYRNIFEYFGEEGKPDESVFHAIDKLGLKYWRKFDPNRTPKLKSDYYRRLFDPRNNFIG